MPQYAASFALNLRGDTLARLTASQLPMLGVTDRED